MPSFLSCGGPSSREHPHAVVDTGCSGLNFVLFKAQDLLASLGLFYLEIQGLIVSRDASGVTIVPSWFDLGYESWLANIEVHCKLLSPLSHHGWILLKIVPLWMAFPEAIQKTQPFINQAAFYHFKNGIVWFLDPHCIL